MQHCICSSNRRRPYMTSYSYFRLLNGTYSAYSGKVTKLAFCLSTRLRYGSGEHLVTRLSPAQEEPFPPNVRPSGPRSGHGVNWTARVIQQNHSAGSHAYNSVSHDDITTFNEFLENIVLYCQPLCEMLHFDCRVEAASQKEYSDICCGLQQHMSNIQCSPSTEYGILRKA